MAIASLSIGFILIHQVFIIFKIYLIVNRLKTCMSYNYKNWGVILKLEYQLNEYYFNPNISIYNMKHIMQFLFFILNDFKS